ncbi:MAG: ShlB/FhaC/HecB family hemolysin secretion/activation protein [Phycisphaerales bacterium]|nr:ShlB/FhaC/HecB family hemolysin secretion/activation protein [Phycisphaerales bacterium]
MKTFRLTGAVSSKLPRRQLRAYSCLSAALIAAWVAGGVMVPAGSAATQVMPAKPVPTKAPEPAISDGPAYPVSAIVVEYAKTVAGQPPLGDILDHPVVVGLSGDGYVTACITNANGQHAYRAGVSRERMALKNLSQPKPRMFHASAIRSIARQISEYLSDKGLGVYVAVSLSDFSGDKDIRPHGDTILHYVVHTDIVAKIATTESGGRFAWRKTKVNDPESAWIAANSPVQPTASAKAGKSDLVNLNAINDYIYALDRQPGRQVSAVYSPDKHLADAYDVNYLVHEQRPWHVYFQLSNTGTSATNPWRERVGVIDNNLTGHDDILSFDYSTAGFTRENAVNGSYSFPLPGFAPDRLRARIYADYESFSAADVGLANANFNGDMAGGGAELDANIYQHGHLFVDLIPGIKYQHIRVDNTFAGITGSGDFIQPYLTLHAERYTPVSQCWGDLTLLTNFTGTNKARLASLGRLNVDQNWAIVQGDINYATYLEPLINPDAYRHGVGGMANQILISVRGQEAFNQRLPAEEEYVAGGYYTVRGYPESATAGDSVGIESFEYRLHIPRLFPVNPHPGSVFGRPFRFSPQEPYAAPDWDLIASAFVDVGEVVNSHRQVYESDGTLVGTGLGLELDIKQNIQLITDWGVALNRIGASSNGNEVTPGSSQFNFVFSFNY